MECVFFDSLDTSCKIPTGAVKSNEQVTFNISISKKSGIVFPKIIIYEQDNLTIQQIQNLEFVEHIKLQNDIMETYRCVVEIESPGLYFYCFSAKIYHGEVYIKKAANGFECELNPEHNNLWQLTVYDSNFSTPDFLKGKIMYQIFPDRFFNSRKKKNNVPKDRKLRLDWGNEPEHLPNNMGEITNSDYFMGDINGIIEKLPYLQSLNVSAIYLNPIFEAHSNHRYDTADYMKIDALLGTEEDFKNLCNEASKFNIKIIIDCVFSHTGDDSIYFNKQNRYNSVGAYNSIKSRYFNWYNFINYPDEYKAWWGFKTLPELNKKNKDYVEFICGDNGVIKKWLSSGCSGIRLDVADELPNSFLEAINKCVKSHSKDAIIIGEVWEDASNKISYGERKRYFLGEQLDSVMNYVFQNAILNYVKFGDYVNLKYSVLSVLENYPKTVVDTLMNTLSTHDTVRAITYLADCEYTGQNRNWQANQKLYDSKLESGIKLMKIATTMQYFFVGVPCVYYGDEIGLQGYKDPFNRRCFDWNKTNSDLANFYKTLGKIRANNAMLHDAAFRFIHIDEDICIFERYDNFSVICISINRSQNDRILKDNISLKQYSMLITKNNETLLNVSL